MYKECLIRTLELLLQVKTIPHRILIYSTMRLKFFIRLLTMFRITMLPERELKNLLRILQISRNDAPPKFAAAHTECTMLCKAIVGRVRGLISLTSL